MSQTKDDTNPMDPFGAWRQMRDSGMEQWSKAMIEMVNSEAYAEATGKMLDTYLDVSAPFREAIEASMTQALAQFNMPSRDEVISLAERFTNIEMRLDDLDAKLDTVLARLSPPPAPRRGKAKERE